MFSSHIRQLALVWTVAFLVGWAWNSWNLHLLNTTEGTAHLVRHGRSLATADDPSYLRPIDDLLSPAEDNKAVHVFRTPGYGLWYLLMRLLLPLPFALTGLVLLQCMLFGTAVALMFHTMVIYRLAYPLIWTCTLLLATMPMFHGFLFHTLTEGVTPALSIAVWATAMEGARTGNKRWLSFGTAVWALVVLTRPVLVWVGAPLLLAIATRGALRARWKQVFLFIAIGLAPTALWWLRNVVVTGGPIALHPVYSENTNGLFRPTHQAFWELAKSWGIKGDTFHGIMVPAFDAAMQGHIDTTSAMAFVASAPQGHLTTAQRERITDLFTEWERFTRDQLAPSLRTEMETLMGLQRTEQHIITGLNAETKAYRKAHPWHYHVVVPIQVLRTMVLHSNLNLYMFQHTYRGRWWMELLRWISGALHLLLFTSLPLVLLVRSVDHRCRITALGALVYLFYLAYVQRGVEERYTLPVLYLALALLPFLVNGLLYRSPRNLSSEPQNQHSVPQLSAKTRT